MGFRHLPLALENLCGGPCLPFKTVLKVVVVQLVDYLDLTPEQRQQLLDIEVTPEQKDFSGDIASALYSLVGLSEDAVRGFALLVEGVPLAFLLVKRGQMLAPWAHAQAATVNALQVDYRQQKRGLGRACLAALPAAVGRVWPQVIRLELSVDAGNEAALGLYRAMGWVDQGEAYKGRVGFERRMVLGL
jgi:ribosomal protein S18 acetylase RimI-like enzyme